MTIWAIVPAAGSGRRMGEVAPDNTPKQYLLIHDTPILAHSLRKLLAVPAISKVVVVLHPEDRHFGSIELATHERIATALGGEQRQDSVLNGLKKLAGANDDDWVLVHDAVRPCVEPGDILNLIAVLLDDPVGGLLGTPLDNTLKQVDESGRVRATPDRSQYWQALTPQMFRYGLLKQALQKARDTNMTITDESAAVEALGHKPQMVQGDKRNIKITHHGDLAIARLILEEQKTIGQKATGPTG